MLVKASTNQWDLIIGRVFFNKNNKDDMKIYAGTWAANFNSWKRLNLKINIYL